MFCKAVPEPPLGFPDVEEATPGTADAVYHIGRCAGEHLLDVESLLGAWDGGEGGGMGAGVALPAVAGKSAGCGGAGGECGADKGVTERVVPPESR